MAYQGKRPSFNGVVYSPQSTEPTSPVEGQMYYSDGTPAAEGLYIYKNGAWESVEGGGAGGINYIENSDAESATTGYATYDDGASATPVDGTGGTSANLTFTRNTSSPLRGVADFDLAKGAADAQGEGVSYDFSIDSADQASIIRVSFDYTVSANYADADMGVYIYDVTNSTLIRMSKEDIDATSLKGHFVSEFQSAPDSTSYRLILHVQSTNATAYDLNFDNVQVGPRSIARGPVVTDWEEYTINITGASSDPTKGTTSIDRALWRRSGGDLEVIYQFEQSGSGGADGSGSYLFSLPSGLTIDTSRIQVGTTPSIGATIGHGYGKNGSVARTGFDIFAYDSSHVACSTNTAANSVSIVGSGQLGLGFDNDAGYFFNFKVPIQGWSSNMTVSEDFGGRVIAARASLTGTQSISSGVNTAVQFSTVDFDTVSMWNGTDGWTIPETGYYHVDAALEFAGNAAGLRQIQVSIPSLAGYNVWFLASGDASANNQYGRGSTVIYAEKGQEIKIFAIQTSGGSLNIGGSGQGYNFITINKIQSPETLAGGEVVAARYSTNSGQSLPNAADTVINFEDKDYDTHNAVTTGGSWTFTAPVSGKYNISTHCALSNTSFTTGNTFFMRIRVNGSDIAYNAHYAETASSNLRFNNISTSYHLNKGDTVSVVEFQNSGSAATLESSGLYNFISIEKIN